jgi:formamidopyrimidine-DNA glycosylase
MPELPEVETICRELSNLLIGRKILSIEPLRENTIIYNTELIENQTISKIERRAKYIVISLSKGQQLVIHLRMTGKLIFPITNNFDSKYTRAIIYIDNDDEIHFDDIRCFGKIYINEQNQTNDQFAKLGIEPLTDDFNVDFLYQKAKNRNQEIKPFLMNQEIVVGIGNIYVQEILFHSKINPTRKAKTIKKHEWQKIIYNTKNTLLIAIDNNGTTISDFRRVDDKTGEFQNFLQVYGKDNCPICDNKLEYIKQAGRSTRYCKECQK